MQRITNAKLRFCTFPQGSLLFDKQLEELAADFPDLRSHHKLTVALKSGWQVKVIIIIVDASSTWIV